ncbi:MAG: NAD(P)H-quinone oxidoreductase [Prochlorococcus sp. SP3034]|nr:NAD(P)H-quinone oxidoreductase [Prochlorococcus sp. SP3034]|tara:strand:- start:2843 stop:3085 length:243 start_codon:yes stop_codon:yes gene_type:complete
MTESIPQKPLKKGSLVFVDFEVYSKSIEALASDKDLPNYVFEGPGEILSIKDQYAQVRWRRPVPDVWFKLDQLKEFIIDE